MDISTLGMTMVLGIFLWIVLICTFYDYQMKNLFFICIILCFCHYAGGTYLIYQSQQLEWVIKTDVQSEIVKIYDPYIQKDKLGFFVDDQFINSNIFNFYVKEGDIVRSYIYKDGPYYGLYYNTKWQHEIIDPVPENANP